MGYLDTVEEKVLEWIKTNEKFSKVVKECFAMADKDKSKTVDAKEAAGVISMFFDKIQNSVTEYGIKVERISEDQAAKLLKKYDTNTDGKLDEEEFKEYFIKVLTIAAYKGVKGFGKKYGLGILGGIVGVVGFKQLVKSVPVLDELTGPLQGLLQPWLIGPLVGCAVVYGMDKGDMFAAIDKLFPPKDKKPTA